MDTSYAYDATGNFMTSVTNASNNTTEYTYTTRGEVSTVKDPLNYTTSYTYDDLGRTASVSSSSRTVGFTYDHDRLSAVTVNNGVYTFDYDSLGRMTTSRIDGAPIVSSSFDAYSRMDSQKVTGDPVRTYFTYDVLDRLSKTTYNGSEKRYYYASDGTLAQTTDTLSNSRTAYLYDSFGRPLSQREYTGTSLSVNTLKNGADYTYDNATGRMTAVKLTSPLGANTVSVVYGSLASGKIPTNV